MASQLVPELQRVTTLYDPNEDRIRLNAQLQHGEAITLWLTQRLLKLIIPHLLKWLETNAPATSNPAKTDFSKTDTPSRPPGSATPASNISEKETSTAAESSTAPVQPRASNARTADVSHAEKPVEPVLETGLSVLVASVDFSSNERIVRLSFKSEKSAPPFARLTFRSKTLGAWLEIVQSQWRKASWPDEIWPLSMAKDAADVYAHVSATLH